MIHRTVRYLKRLSAITIYISLCMIVTPDQSSSSSVKDIEKMWVPIFYQRAQSNLDLVQHPWYVPRHIQLQRKWRADYLSCYASSLTLPRTASCRSKFVRYFFSVQSWLRLISVNLGSSLLSRLSERSHTSQIAGDHRLRSRNHPNPPVTQAYVWCIRVLVLQSKCHITWYSG